MKYSTFLLTIFAALMSCLHLDASKKQPLPDKISVIREKVSLSLDKEGYVSGDTIRFRGALLDAATGDTLRNFSRYLYVELIDPFGETVSRVKIKERDGLFPGIIPLDRELPESRYTLAAYTVFLENLPSDYFYRRPLDIASVYGINNRMDATLDGKTLTVSLADKRTGRPIECRVLTISGPDPEPLRTLYNRTSVSGKIPRDIHVVKVSLDHYSKFIPLPASESDRRIEFYPEGGSLVPGAVNMIAFRSEDSEGRWLATEGHVETSGGERVADLRSGHSGYGVFYLNPEDDETYYAVVGDTRTPLPAATSSGPVLRVQTLRKDHLIISSAGDIPAGSRLMVERAGEPLLICDATGFPLSIDRGELGEGLLAVTLTDTSGVTLSRRLVFNPPAEFLDSPSSGKDISRSLTLLQQDLATHVDSIIYYGESARHMSEIDAMLLANSSERYHQLTELRYPVEIGGEISGVIKSRWKGKPIKGATINIISPDINFGMMATTDAEGRFYLNGFDWPDGTVFLCQALGTKGQQEHNFTVTPDQFPEIAALPLRSELAGTDQFDVIYDSYVPEGIMLDELIVTARADDEESRKVMMRALGVRALDTEDFKLKGISNYEEALYTIPQITIRNGNIVSKRPSSIHNIYPAVEIWIDGSRMAMIMPGSFNSLTSTLPFHDVATLEYVPPHMAMSLSGSAAHGGGALVITSKSGDGNYSSRDFFKQYHRPLGYQREPSALTPW